MRIVFIHRTIVDYTVETPYEKGVGGTEAALSYLTVELARLGHSVTLVANPSTPGRYLGVECLNHNTALSPGLTNAADAVVVANESCGSGLRDKYRAIVPLIAWIGHDVDQDSIQRLEYTRERKAWSAFAFVSQWQLQEFCRIFWIAHEKCRVMRNAISPAFAAIEPSEPWFRNASPPMLAYTSAPYRGLDVLISAFPAIRRAVPGACLRIFSGMGQNVSDPLNRPYEALYKQCLATEGVHLTGRIGQTELAREIAQCAALAYPSTFPETSCIAVMEAMSAGAAILTTRTGALPETTAGFAHMVEAAEDTTRLAKDFAEMVIAALYAIRTGPDAAAARRNQQIAYARHEYAWPARAQEWQAWLTGIVRQHARGP
jgi:glycosyltransferase involved in cell wall biosynthesis